MATRKTSKNSSALKLTPKTPKTTPLTEALEKVAALSTPPGKITFTIEQVLAWPPDLQQKLGDLLRLDMYWDEMEEKRIKFKLRYLKRKLAKLIAEEAKEAVA
jgi:hypothetical protein